MVFDNQLHKNIIKELGFNPDRDYRSDDITADLFSAVVGRVQRQGFTYDGDEPIPTTDGLLCEEIADLLSEIE